MSEVSIGVGLRPTHFSHIESKLNQINHGLTPKWFEAVSENYMDSLGRPLEMLLKVRKHFPVALHGVSLSLGSTDELNLKYLDRLKDLIEKVDPFVVSDHLCWTGLRDQNLHDLLPLPFTKECMDHLLSRIDFIQNYLGRSFVFENVSTYLRFEKNDWPEWEFLNELSKRSGAKILLDANNIYVNAINHGFDANEYVDGIDIKNVAQIHLAGYSDQGDFLFDTHSQPVHSPVWELFKKVMSKNSSLPSMIEWDEEIPPFERLESEANKAHEVATKVRAKSSQRSSQ